MANHPIPHMVEIHRAGRIVVTTWPGEATVGDPKDGYVRSFDAISWPRAAAYVDELKRGIVSGRY